ncbi:MAG TPA: 2-phospho-L-lactate transferase CofD family protein, partial [Candidatus Paceibacterota bacterium]
MEKKNIIIIGGGTGTHTILRGLKRYQKQVNLSAIVTMADSGGSTGRLRDEFGYLPVGDVRMALAALASDIDEHEELLRQLFLYRFDRGNGLSGHNFGNLLLVALTDILGSEEEAIRAAARVLRVQGQVVPVTTQPVDLVATYDDGVVLVGEHLIDEPSLDRLHRKITHLSVQPQATISARAEEA